MNIKRLKNACLTTVVCLVMLISLPAAAVELGGLSIGYEALSSSKDDPKNKNIGSITAKYGFGASNAIKPYIGTGLAYSYSEQDKQPKPGETPAGLKTGMAGQVGINYLLGGNVSLSVDYKFLNLQPDAKSGVNDPSTQKIGVGIDIKF